MLVGYKRPKNKTKVESIKEAVFGNILLLPCFYFYAFFHYWYIIESGFQVKCSLPKLSGNLLFQVIVRISKLMSTIFSI
jgi:hypothetical protein